MILDSDGRPMIAVHTCWNDAEAEIVIGFLRVHDIEARANSEIPHSILPLTTDGLGEIQVLVSEEDAALAREIIRQRAESAASEGASEDSSRQE